MSLNIEIGNSYSFWYSSKRFCYAFLHLILRFDQKPFSIFKTSYISEIRRTFQHLDKNEDNKLSAAEFVRGGKIIGVQMTKEEAQQMINGVDTDGNIKRGKGWINNM